jgi:hypothetical protein
MPYSNQTGLYPETIFHFTPSLDNLYGILSQTFKPQFSEEKVTGKSKTMNIHVPVVSFSDIKLSEIHTHIAAYGKYGLGMSKTWATAKELNTVFYVNSLSSHVDTFFEAIDFHRTRVAENPEDETAKTELVKAMNILRFMKNYEGPLERKNRKTIPSYRFANEREWRYVPRAPWKDLPGFVNTSQRNAYCVELTAAAANQRLEFEPSDIRYIVIAKESERPKVIQKLRDIKQKYSKDEVNELASRILSAEQIQTDF